MTGLRQWCHLCQRATRSWIDRLGETRCASCDPPDPQSPGDGIRDRTRRPPATG
jgi:hypothetical protein